MESAENLPINEVETLDDLVLAAHQELEAAVLRESNRAFNLGLRTWLIPGTLTIIAVFIFSKSNWAMTAITAALIGMAVIVFAIFVASQSKAKSPARIYEKLLAGEVNRKLPELGHTLDEFSRRALELLPAEALLAQLLRQQENDREHPNSLPEEESE